MFQAAARRARQCCCAGGARWTGRSWMHRPARQSLSATGRLSWP